MRNERCTKQGSAREDGVTCKTVFAQAVCISRFRGAQQSLPHIFSKPCPGGLVFRVQQLVICTRRALVLKTASHPTFTGLEMFVTGTYWKCIRQLLVLGRKRFYYWWSRSQARMRAPPSPICSPVDILWLNGVGILVPLRRAAAPCVAGPVALFSMDFLRGFVG